MIEEIGQGGFGCVYSPPLDCRNKNLPKQCKTDNCVSKRFKSRFAYDHELKTMESIEKIDKDGKYHFKLYGDCPESKDYSVTEHCRGSLKLKNPPLIYYEKGEKNLDTILNEIIKSKSHDEYYDLMYNLLNLFNGLIFFEKHKFVHHDLKGNNIVRTIDGKYKFIDFGSSIDYSKKIDENNDFTYNYLFWPAEIIYLDNSDDSHFDDDFLKSYVESFYGWLNRAIGTKYNEVEKLVNYLKFLRIPRKEIIKKLDIYAFGIVLTSVYFVGVEIGAEIASDKLLKLIKGMYDIVVERRYSPEKARDEFIEYLKELDRELGEKGGKIHDETFYEIPKFNEKLPEFYETPKLSKASKFNEKNPNHVQSCNCDYCIIHLSMDNKFEKITDVDENF